MHRREAIQLAAENNLWNASGMLTGQWVAHLVYKWPNKKCEEIRVLLKAVQMILQTVGIVIYPVA